jgi:hypothetical protein
VLQAAHKELHRILSEAEPRMQRSFLKPFIRSVETDGKQAKVTYNLACLCPEVFVPSGGHVGVPTRPLVRTLVAACARRGMQAVTMPDGAISFRLAQTRG